MTEQGDQEDLRVKGYRILKSHGLPKPENAPQELWDQAGPKSVQAATDLMQAQLTVAIITEANREMPRDEKAVLKRYFPQAVAVRAEIMNDPNVKSGDRLAASATFIEHTVGKPEVSVKHSGSLALEIHDSIDKLTRGLKSGQIIDTENLLPKTSPVIEAFIKKHSPEKFIVGKKAALDGANEGQPTEGLLAGVGNEAEPTGHDD